MTECTVEYDQETGVLLFFVRDNDVLINTKKLRLTPNTPHAAVMKWVEEWSAKTKVNFLPLPIQ